MLLAIDTGNTDTVLGIFRNDKLLGTERFPSNPADIQRFTIEGLDLLFRKNGIVPGDIQSCCVSSVVPQITAFYRSWGEEYLHTTPLIVSGKLPLGITIHYDDSGTLGADRICNIIAAFHKYGGPAIVIDFGTATTYDVVGEKGDFLGGVIAPGLKSSAAGLLQRTAQLPEVELRFPPGPLGNSTISSIQSGILYGGVDAAAGMIKRIKSVVGEKAVVIATGGLSEILAGELRMIDHRESHLVLEGARLIFERCKK